MAWDERGLTVNIHEICSPIPFPLRGDVRLTPSVLYDAPVALDAAGRHHWRAVATDARIEVNLSAPNLSWSGTAYHDMNWGEEPLEAAFRDWTWSRAETAEGTTVLYDVTTVAKERRAFGRHFGKGEVSEHPLASHHELPRGLWGMRRPVLSEQPPRLKLKLEDAPFYARSVLGLRLLGEDTIAVHESLSLDRFKATATQLMLPFRMPRRA